MESMGSAAIGSLVPCPISNCDQGRFDISNVQRYSQAVSIKVKSEEKDQKCFEVIDLCSDGSDDDAETSDMGTISDVLSRSITSDDVPSSGNVVTPVPMKVKNEPSADDIKSEHFAYDTDESRFSEGFESAQGANPYKQETDEESNNLSNARGNIEDESDEESRFSDISDSGALEMDHNENEVQKEASDQEEPEKKDDEPMIKEEPTIYELEKRQAKNSRKYGDRVLLARQSKLGMMKLGGGNQGSDLFPVDPVEREQRMDGRLATAYGCLWNFGAPRYAGQPSGHVGMFPRPRDDYDALTTPFSVFVQRLGKGHSTLGWEYCGEYILFDDLKGIQAAHTVSLACKKQRLFDIQKSIKRPNGCWHDKLAEYRREILNACKLDSSPPGPQRLIRFINDEPEPNDEGKDREERLDRESRERASDAAKARALGLDNPELSDIEFAKRLIHYDPFYGSYAIKFVRYDEEMYNFVKKGMTNKNKDNKMRASGETTCAKASDWYNIMDMQLDQNDREEKRNRKRKRQQTQD